MKDKLNETEECLWNIKDDEDFEQKSQEIIDGTIEDLNDIFETSSQESERSSKFNSGTRKRQKIEVSNRNAYISKKRRRSHF